MSGVQGQLLCGDMEKSVNSVWYVQIGPFNLIY